MIVCQCTGQTDRHIREIAAQGARTLEEVALRSQAGAGCGGCQKTIECLLRDVCRNASMAGPMGAVAPAFAKK